MLIKEYRVTMPMTVPEYQIGQLYTVAETSKNETGGGEGIEILTNEPFADYPLLNGRYSNGQYSHKIYHANQRVPRLVRLVMPSGSLDFHEISWNAYPYIRTIITMAGRKDICIAIDSIHLPDRGHEENAHMLPPEKLKMREVVFIDIGEYDVDLGATSSLRPTGRGSLKGNWRDTVNPVMTCYKLVTVEMKVFGLQSAIEAFTHRYEKRLFTKFHRDVVKCMDSWLGLNMADIRIIEDKTKKELETKIQK